MFLNEFYCFVYCKYFGVCFLLDFFWLCIPFMYINEIKIKSVKMNVERYDYFKRKRIQKLIRCFISFLRPTLLISETVTEHLENRAATACEIWVLSHS